MPQLCAVSHFTRHSNTLNNTAALYTVVKPHSKTFFPKSYQNVKSDVRNSLPEEFELLANCSTLHSFKHACYIINTNF